ncbi:hypothetical protein Plec18170_009717 [Paecilomyces lecythidis]
MAGRRTYNEKRTEYNRLCREKLSAQLRNRLGLKVEPSQVRLKTENTEDPYSWEVTEDMRHMFDKNFSDLSTGSLIKLYEGLDEENLKVVAVEKSMGKDAEINQESGTSWPRLSFQARISLQQQQIDQMNRELHEWKGIAESESKERYEAQCEVGRLLDCVKHAEENRRFMEREVAEWKQTAKHLRNSVGQCHQGTDMIVKALDHLRGTRLFVLQSDVSDPTSSVE